MGLDSYLFREKRGDTQFNLSYKLVGGFMTSGDGSDGSFRGGEYDCVIYEATGYTLHTEHLTPDEVKDLANKLKNWFEQSDEVDKVASFCDVFPEEIKALVELFTQAAEKGCQYEGWF